MHLETLISSVIALAEHSAIADAIREDDLLFPLIETVHVLAISLVVGSISIVDLRLLGLASVTRPAGALTRSVLPITWMAFAFAVTSGALLFVSHASQYLANKFFLAKLAIIVAAGLNMALFHAITAKGLDRWDMDPLPPAAARAAGALSLLLWIFAIACGRWIGFTMPPG